VGNKINKLHKQKYFRGIRTSTLGPLTGGVSVCKGDGVWLEANKKLGGGGLDRYTEGFLCRICTTRKTLH